MSATGPRDRDDARRLLAIYLRDHLAGAAAGLALAKRTRRSNSGTEFEPLLADIEHEIADDREALRLMMRRLGVAESRTKQAIGLAGELFGRLKSNGRVVHYSPSTRVVEIESLIGAIAMKRCVWMSLEMIAERRQGLDASELERLVERAARQLDRLRGAHARAASLAFHHSDDELADSQSFRRGITGVLTRRSVSPAAVGPSRKETHT